jgi:prepilin-type processing-associated H-X9-DG protein
MKAGVACLVMILIGAVAIASETVRILVFGWIAFLGRTIPRATINLSGVVSGAVTLVLLVALVHYFGRWLARASSAEPGAARRPWRLRWSLSIVGSVILMFVVGYASVGLARHLGWIFSSGSMYAPRVYGTSWPHADAQAEETNHLKGFGLSFLFDCEALARGADRRIVGKFDEPRQSWAPLLLYGYWFPTFHPELPWNHPDNAAIFRTPIREFYNPTLVGADQFDQDGFALIHYAGNTNVLGTELNLKLSDVHGGSNTILLGEVNGNFQPWGKPGNVRDPAAGINTPGGFGGAEASGGAQFLMLDGSVRFISKDVDPEVLKALAK